MMGMFEVKPATLAVLRLENWNGVSGGPRGSGRRTNAAADARPAAITAAAMAIFLFIPNYR
jgi:hypothetical protein